MAESVIERAARAVREADGAYPMDRTGGWMTEGGVVGDGHWVDLARAAIEALREPTGEMCADVHDALLYAVKGEELDTARLVWERMIEVALA